MLTSRMSKASVYQWLQASKLEFIKEYQDSCIAKKRRIQKQCLCPTYLYCASPPPLLKGRKERRDRRVFDHTLQSLRDRWGAMNSFGIRLFPSDWSCWSCHQHELEETKCLLEHPSYLRSIEVQADVGETQEQTQPLNYGCHQQYLVLLESSPWCVSHILVQGLDPFHLHSLDVREMKTVAKGSKPEGDWPLLHKGGDGGKTINRKYTEVPGAEIRGNWKSRTHSLSFNTAASSGRRGNFFVTNLNFPFTFFLFFFSGLTGSCFCGIPVLIWVTVKWQSYKCANFLISHCTSNQIVGHLIEIKIIIRWCGSSAIPSLRCLKS